MRLTNIRLQSQVLRFSSWPSVGSWKGFHQCAIVQDNSEKSASSKLFADAACEEADESQSPQRNKPSNVTLLEQQNENWTGEESMQDAVLRMLVDKYKPLRSGSIRSAEEKLKQTPPQISLDPAVVSPGEREAVRDWRTIANEPLLPAVEGHKPWLTTFKAPSHATASIKLGTFPPASSKTSRGLADLDERTRRTERELQKRKEQAGRLSRARESTLDYRMGIKRGDGPSRRPNPVTMRGWQSMIEDKIDKARIAGHFDKVKGRGKPLVTHIDERNPFIAREEFLMNRIVQRNGATPPWVDVQIELETTINSFRETLRQSWTRRAIRMLTMSQPATRLPSLTLIDVTSLRDKEWEERERSYHDAAIAELNTLVRKYNAMAPYAVRRPVYARNTELANAYQDCGEDILRGISEWTQEQVSWQSSLARSRVKSPSVGDVVNYGRSFKLWDVIRDWLGKLMRRTGR